MFKIVFYEERGGFSEINDSLMELAKKSIKSKDARIQFNQITYCIELLKIYDSRLSEKIAKHIRGDLWELRPGDNRILYFYYIGDTYVLLHMFRKKTQKTPISEIEKAEREIADYKQRNGGKAQ